MTKEKSCGPDRLLDAAVALRRGPPHRRLGMLIRTDLQDDKTQSMTDVDKFRV